uniref:Uncharacterized protein n=1 Tax=Rhizophora mucronata TaxID=61149 RepID=A0A2P2LFH3_RHIMU
MTKKIPTSQKIKKKKQDIKQNTKLMHSTTNHPQGQKSQAWTQSMWGIPCQIQFV